MVKMEQESQPHFQEKIKANQTIKSVIATSGLGPH